MKAEEIKKFTERLERILELRNQLFELQKDLECKAITEDILFYRKEEEALCFAKEQGLRLKLKKDDVADEAVRWCISFYWKDVEFVLFLSSKQYQYYAKEGLLP